MASLCGILTCATTAHVMVPVHWWGTVSKTCNGVCVCVKRQVNWLASWHTQERVMRCKDTHDCMRSVSCSPCASPGEWLSKLFAWIFRQSQSAICCKDKKNYDNKSILQHFGSFEGTKGCQNFCMLIILNCC